MDACQKLECLKNELHALSFLGPQGSGKDTEAKIVSRLLGGRAVISTGEELRNLDLNTSDGMEAKRYISEGLQAPDEIVIRVLKERIKGDDAANGWVLTGFPRTKKQAELCENDIRHLDRVVFLNLPESVSYERTEKRRICKDCGINYSISSLAPIIFKPKKDGICNSCGGSLYQRADDRPEAISKRLKFYYDNERSIKDFYKGLGTLVEVDLGYLNSTLEEVTQKIINAL
jgi:adenylate kinase